MTKERKQARVYAYIEAIEALQAYEPAEEIDGISVEEQMDACVELADLLEKQVIRWRKKVGI